MSLVLHAELGERTAADNQDSFEESGSDHAGAHRDGVIGAAAERLHVRPASVLAPGHFADRLGQITPATLVAVAHGFFASVHDVRNRIRCDIQIPEERLGRHNASGLGGEVFQQNVGKQGDVPVMSPVQHTHEGPVAEIHGEVPRARLDLLFDLA